MSNILFTMCRRFVFVMGLYIKMSFVDRSDFCVAMILSTKVLPSFDFSNLGKGVIMIGLWKIVAALSFVSWKSTKQFMRTSIWSTFGVCMWYIW